MLRSPLPAAAASHTASHVSVPLFFFFLTSARGGAATARPLTSPLLARPRPGWGRGGGRLLDRDTEDAGEGGPGWLLSLPGDQCLGMGPPATGTVLLGGWPCCVIKGCLGSASTPAPGNHSFLLCGDHDGPSGTSRSLRSSWEPLPSPPPPDCGLLGPQRGAPPSGEVCAVRCDRTPEASPH